MRRNISILLIFCMMLFVCACQSDPTQGAVAVETLPTASTATTTTVRGATTTSSDKTTATTHTTGTTAVGHEHTYEVIVRRAPSCEQDGERQYTCACGDTYTEAIPALGHQWKDASCAEPKTCAVCGETEGKALGHTFADGVCTVCGATDPNYRSLYSGRWAYFSSTRAGVNLMYLDLAELRYSEGKARAITSDDPEWETSLTTGRHVPYGSTMLLWQQEITDITLTDVAVAEKEATATLTFDGGSITVERTAKNKFRVASVSGTCSLRVNMVLTWVSK